MTRIPSGPTLRATVLGQNVLRDIYFILPFSENTLFSIPLRIFISNTGNKTAKNVTVILEVPDTLYRHNVERAADKVSVARRVQIISDADSNTHIARAYYVIPEIHPNTATDVRDHIFAKEDSILESSFDITTKDGIPVTIPYKVHYSFRLKVGILGDDISPHTIEHQVHLRQGDFTNVQAVLDRENERIYEDAERTGELSRDDMTLLTFQKFIQDPVESTSLIVCRADNSSMLGVNVRATTLGFRPVLALSLRERIKYRTTEYFITTFPVLYRYWKRGVISKQLKRIKLHRRLEIELGPWQRTGMKSQFGGSLFFSTTAPNPRASVFSLNLRMLGTAGLTDHTSLVLSYPARCLITNRELKELAPEGSYGHETLRRRSHKVVGDTAYVTFKIDKLVHGEARVLVEPMLLVTGGMKGEDSRFNESGFAGCLRLISVIPNLSDVVIVECAGTSKSSRSIRKNYNVGWLIDPQDNEQWLDRFLESYSDALWFGEKPPFKKIYLLSPWNGCRIIRKEPLQICRAKVRDINSSSIPSVAEVIPEEVALGFLSAPDCNYHHLPKHVLSKRDLTRWMGGWCLNDQVDQLRALLWRYRNEADKS